MLQILTIFSALQGDVVFRATVRKSDFHMSHANYTMQHGIRFRFVHCKINWESVMGILHNDEILGCDFQVVGFRRKSRFAIKGDNAKSLLVFEKNALRCEPYCSIAPPGRDPPLGHVRSSSSTDGDDDALRGYQNLYAKEYATRS